MHELGIVFHVIKSVEKIGEENGLTNVASVTLELGEVSGAIPHELESCWNWAVKKTELLPEAALKIETIPAVTYCEGCGRDYPTRAVWPHLPALRQRKNVAQAGPRDQLKGD